MLLEATMRTLLVVIFCLAIAVNAAFAQNAIVAENQLPGTPASQWDLSGPGSITLQGFTTDISVNHGLLAQIMRFEQVTKAAHRRLVRHRLAAEIDPDKAAHR